MWTWFICNAEAAARRRNVASGEETDVDMYSQEIESADGRSHSTVQWKRILLLIVAITVHNIPGMHVVTYV